MAKQITQEGYVTYSDVCFFRSCMAKYAGCELDPDGRNFGLEPKKLYNVFRPPEEVTKPSFVMSCNAKPLRIDHPREGGMGNIDGLESPTSKVAGTVSEVRVVGTELHGRVDVYDPRAIEAIRNGMCELSLGYSCSFVRRSGEYNGEHYDFVQSGLKAANHLALVDEARNGSQCRVSDCKHVCDSKFKLEQPDMDMSKLSADELVEGLKGCSDECKAKAKEFLSTPTEDEKKQAEEKAKADEEAKKTADAEAAAKAETEKKEAVDAAVEETKKADKEECDKACEVAAKDAVAKYQKAIELANDCKPKFGTIDMTGIRSEKDVAVKVCACDAAPAFLKSVKSEGAIVALRGYLAGAGSKAVEVRANDSKTAGNGMSVDSYLRTI